MAELNSHDEYRGSGGGEQVPEGAKHGPKYWLDIEGELKPWDRDTITTEQVIQLGGWDPSQGAIIIDKDRGNETENRARHAGFCPAPALAASASEIISSGSLCPFLDFPDDHFTCGLLAG